MAQITYADKVALNVNAAIADINKVNATDMNEIKNVINTNDNNVGDLSALKTDTTSSIVGAINELKDAEIYSTSEVKTNKIWINNKPIYRRVYSANITGTSLTVNHGLSNVTITSFESHITNGSNTFNGNTWRADSSSAMFCYLTSTAINWNSGGTSRNGYTLYVTLEYVKN